MNQRAHEQLANAQIDEAIATVIEAVKAQPTHTPSRLLLTDLLCINAEWDRALRQLDALEASASDLASTVASYRVLIEAERARAAALGGPESSLRWMIEPPDWVETYRSGLGRIAAGQPEEGHAALAPTLTQLERIEGRLNQQPFRGFRDLDDRLAPLLEVVTQQGLCYTVWDDVRFLDVEKPTVPRDLIWAPARLALKQGPIGRVYLPALYPGSASDPDRAVRLGRKTDWRELAPGLVVGAGLKMFLVGDESLTLFELSELSFSDPADQA